MTGARQCAAPHNPGVQHDDQTERTPRAGRPAADWRRLAGAALRAWASSALAAAVVGLLLELARAAGWLSVAADPTSHGAGLAVGGAIGAALVAALGPQWLEIVATVAAAIIGGMAQASRRQTAGVGAVLRIVALWAGVALVCTGGVVWVLRTRLGVDAPAGVLYPITACAIAAVGDQALARLRSLVSGWQVPGQPGAGRGGKR